MESNLDSLAQIVIFVSIAVGAIFVPSAYSFPKNLLDQLYLYKEKSKKLSNVSDSDFEKNIFYFFYASDIIIFSGGILAFFSTIIGIFILFQLCQLLIILWLFFHLAIMTFYIYRYWKLRTDPQRSSPTWNDICRYMMGIIPIYFIYFVCAFCFACHEKLKCLIFLLLSFLGFHVVAWLIPGFCYAPLTSLQILRKLKNKKD